jgi:putative PIN family toxin of toxin-antitoxin system
MSRAVIDINIYVSATILPRGTPFSILTAWRVGEFVAVASAGMVSELEEKLRSPKLARYQLTETDIQAILTLINTRADLVTVPPDTVVAVTGDPEDDLVLATARIGLADYLITGDRGLLRLGSHEGTAIVTPAAFMASLRGGGPESTTPD